MKRLLFSILRAADRAGLRRVLAPAMSLAWPGRRFSVDEKGLWINRQGSVAFASPGLHTAQRAALRSLVLNDLCRRYTPGPGDVVMDIGAGIGEEAATFADLVGPRGKVYAIEAHPDTFDCLTRTVALSGFRNVIPLHCAVSDEDGEVTISTGEAHICNSVHRGEGGVSVPARSIASLAREYSLDRIDFLYMNIEGAERQAIRGLGEILPKVGNMLISCHDFCGVDELRTREDVRSFLQSNGFTVTGAKDAAEPWVRDYLYASRAL